MMMDAVFPPPRTQRKKPCLCAGNYLGEVCGSCGGTERGGGKRWAWTPLTHRCFGLWGVGSTRGFQSFHTDDAASKKCLEPHPPVLEPDCVLANVLPRAQFSLLARRREHKPLHREYKWMKAPFVHRLIIIGANRTKANHFGAIIPSARRATFHSECKLSL